MQSGAFKGQFCPQSALQVFARVKSVLCNVRANAAAQQAQLNLCNGMKHGWQGCAKSRHAGTAQRKNHWFSTKRAAEPATLCIVQFDLLFQINWLGGVGRQEFRSGLSLPRPSRHAPVPRCAVQRVPQPQVSGPVPLHRSGRSCDGSGN